MGSQESKCLSWACTDKKQREILTSKQDEETKVLNETICPVSSEETPTGGCSSAPSPGNKALLDFAEKMSEDIVVQALLLCWEMKVDYKEFLFIDIECEYVI